MWTQPQRIPRDPVVGLLLAAGRGERLRPQTDEIAKPGLLVGEKPLGAYGLAALGALNGRLAVNLWWMAHELRTVLEPYAPPGTLWLVEAPEPYGTAGTVATLLPELASTFVVFNADTFTDLRVTELWATHRRVGAPATIAVQPVSAGADLAISGERAVHFIDRRVDALAPGVRYIGVAVFERARVMTLLEPGKVTGLGEAVIRPLAEKGELATHIHSGVAIDVGTAERLDEARKSVNEVCSTHRPSSDPTQQRDS